MNAVPLSVLLVVSEPESARAFVRCARAIPGYEVRAEVCAAPERVPLFHRVDQDLVVLGADVCTGTGEELLHWLRDAGDTRPVIVLAEHADAALATRNLRAGADEFLCSAELSPERLEKTIAVMLARKRAREAWREAEQLRIVHEMVVSLSHEINNPLQGVVGYLEYVMEQLGPTHPQHARLAAALHAAERIADLVRRLRDVDHVATRPYLAGETMFDLVDARPGPGSARSSAVDTSGN